MPRSTATRARPVRPSALVSPLGVWAAMAVVAVLNGVFREVVIAPRVGEYPGHVLGTATPVVALLGVSLLYFRRTETAYTRTELGLIGVVWTGLTVGFEFAIGSLEGTPVSVTVGQYDVLAGRVWIAVPLTLLLAPLAFGRRG